MDHHPACDAEHDSGLCSSVTEHGDTQVYMPEAPPESVEIMLDLAEPDEPAPVLSPEETHAVQLTERDAMIANLHRINAALHVKLAEALRGPPDTQR